MFGRQLTAPSDPLERISIERVFQGITSPKPAFRDLIERLRTISSVDLAMYRQLKKKLPYLVCGIFHPAIRRKEHFATIDSFVLDLDHLGEAQLTTAEVRAKLAALSEPMLGFTSPGGDGFKVFFRLAEPCRDAARFHAFYQNFARQFAQKHGLETVVDYQTCDVTRACFMSYDPEAFFKPDATPVAIGPYLSNLFSANPNNTADDGGKTAHGSTKKTTRKTNQKKAVSGPDENALEQIRLKLNPKRRKKRPEKTVVQPEEISEAIKYFEANLAEYNLKLDTAEAISYGRKLRILAPENIWCELNLFYGKRGFSIVKTTKSGSHPDLAEIAANVLSELLYDRFDTLK
jgi:hypothetical protein